MKRGYYFLLALVLLLSGCGSVYGGTIMWQQISQEEAMRLMETESEYVILDVRTQAEYDGGHIPGAILVPHDTIKGDVPQLPDKQQLILVYCRSGNRSKQAAQALADAGYENVREFGGINSWQGEIVTD